jgi:putative inorganic carbon (hco3(-)) transporter
MLLLIFCANFFVDLNNELSAIVLVLVLVSIGIVLLRYKQFLLYFIAFFVPISIPIKIAGGSVVNLPVEVLCVMLFGFILVKLMAGSKFNLKFLTHPITILIFCDLAWLLICSVFSQMPYVSFKRFFIRVCFYTAFYYFYFELFKQDKENIKKVFTLHAIGFLVPIFYAIVRHANLGFTTVGSQRISEPFYFDHTIYGACLVFFIPFLISSFLYSIKFRDKTLYGSLLTIFTIATVLSYSRAAWLSLLIALFFGLVLIYRVNSRQIFFGIGLILIVGIFQLDVIATSLKNNKETSHSNDLGSHIKSVSNIKTDASNKERINRWKCAFRMVADKPVFGFGPGTYQFFYGSYQRREDLTRISTYSGLSGHAHSEYLNYLSETGIPGLVIFVSLLTVVSFKCLMAFKNGKNEQYRKISLYVFMGLLTFVIHGLFNGFLEFDKMAMPVFCSMAIVSSLDIGAVNDPKL